MHLASKQILVSANIAFRDQLTTDEIVDSVDEVEQLVKAAELTVDMIFLETASLKRRDGREVNPKHI